MLKAIAVGSIFAHGLNPANSGLFRVVLFAGQANSPVPGFQIKPKLFVACLL